MSRLSIKKTVINNDRQERMVFSLRSVGMAERIGGVFKPRTDKTYVLETSNVHFFGLSVASQNGEPENLVSSD